MVNRVAFGNLGGGVFGLRISKPGFNVLTTGINNLLFDMNQKSLQVVQSGTFNSTASTIAIPNLGYWPGIIIVPSVSRSLTDGTYGTLWWVTYNSNTSITLECSLNVTDQLPCVYKVLRIPVN